MSYKYTLKYVKSKVKALKLFDYGVFFLIYILPYQFEFEFTRSLIERDDYIFSSTVLKTDAFELWNDIKLSPQLFDIPSVYLIKNCFLNC